MMASRSARKAKARNVPTTTPVRASTMIPTGIAIASPRMTLNSVHKMRIDPPRPCQRCNSPPTKPYEPWNGKLQRPLLSAFRAAAVGFFTATRHCEAPNFQHKEFSCSLVGGGRDGYCSAINSGSHHENSMHRAAALTLRWPRASCASDRSWLDLRDQRYL